MMYVIRNGVVVQYVRHVSPIASRFVIKDRAGIMTLGECMCMRVLLFNMIVVEDVGDSRLVAEFEVRDGKEERERGKRREKEK